LNEIYDLRFAICDLGKNLQFAIEKMFLISNFGFTIEDKNRALPVSIVNRQS